MLVNALLCSTDANQCRTDILPFLHKCHEHGQPLAGERHPVRTDSLTIASKSFGIQSSRRLDQPLSREGSCCKVAA